MFIRRDSGNGLILASHHPKWSLTWSWVLTWDNKRPLWGWYGFRTYKTRGLYGRICVSRLALERQPTMKWDGKL